MLTSSNTPYLFGFTAGGLGASHCQSLARLYVELEDWGEVRREALRTNLFQQAKMVSNQRVELEFRSRLETLTSAQMQLLVESNGDAARSLALLAVFKRYAVIFDFCILKLMPKLTVFDTEVRYSDLVNFFAEVTPGHPEIEKLTDSTLVKVRQVMIKILVDGGILSGTDSPVIAPVPLLPEVARVIAADSPQLLQGYLVDKAEIAIYCTN